MSGRSVYYWKKSATDSIIGLLKLIFMAEEETSLSQTPGEVGQNDLRFIDELTSGSTFENLPYPISKQLVGALARALVQSISDREALEELAEHLREQRGREGFDVGITLGTGRLEGYKIVRRIAGGAHGEVYRVVDPEDRDKIMKVAKTFPDQQDTPDDRVFNEGSAIKLINNVLKENNVEGNIVPQDVVWDLDSYTSPAFVMSYIEGSDASELIEERRKYNPNVILVDIARITHISYLLRQGGREVIMAYGELYGDEMEVCLEPDRRLDTILLDPSTGELKGIIDFSMPGFGIKTIKENPDYVAKEKANSVRTLAYMARKLVDYESAPISYRNFVEKLNSGELKDFAEVFRELEDSKVIMETLKERQAAQQRA
ncbi:hypothetical protein A2Z22_00635 [Candidatus Woesebacteria bacterium RBG_16_34_12]|uniref:Protein kinase domain-containing protein n=1 Tax=Candidatus Woesebacteria bacterium RBG_16_34_12 TaxID=1802480 RepID=A0A1F7X892_9BACT|nr:MAG: hypothetical protein A2Z22_00635 [Candidatus Woesebacteria bacterium RBG_16_34_12]